MGKDGARQMCMICASGATVWRRLWLNTMQRLLRWLRRKNRSKPMTDQRHRVTVAPHSFDLERYRGQDKHGTEKPR